MVRISVVTLTPSDDNNSSWRYHVEITESDGSGSKTTHQVTMSKGLLHGSDGKRTHHDS
jgi:hypothetical protein